MTGTRSTITAPRHAGVPADRGPGSDTDAGPAQPDLAAPAVQFDRSGPDPLHTQIEQFVRALIVDGSWPPRRRLPPEPVLAAQLGVNRGTLRRALAALITQGLLVSQRGRGTFVAPIAAASIAQRFRSLSEDLTSQGFSFRREVIATETGRLPLPVQTVLRAAPATLGLTLKRVFVADEGPLAYLVNYVRAERCPGIEHLDFERVALFDALATNYGITITEGRRSISAQAASSEVSAQLGIAPGAPVLYLEQVSFTDTGDAIEYSDVWINSSRVTITAVLQRD